MRSSRRTALVRVGLVAACALMPACGTALASATEARAAAPSARSAPLRVHLASLQQDGLRLVWKVRTDEPFSPNELDRDRRSLCMLIERASTSTAVGEVCVRRPGSRRHPQLIYRHLTRAGAGRPHTISATVGRENLEQMTASFLPSSIGVDYRPIRWQVQSTGSDSACASARPALSCAAKFPAFPALAKLHFPRPVGCTASGPPLAFAGPSSRHEVALTFDDGPWPDTPRFLDVLEREHVHATFFQIGEQISTYGTTVDRRMLADGDMIGDHTWSHVNVAAAGPAARQQISRASAAIRNATGGFTSCLFRAPGGAISRPLEGLARTMGFTTIQWNVDPTDWSRPGADAIYRRVVGAVRNGSIVIQHDGGGDRSETLAALPREIDTLKAKGFRFVTVAELLGDRIIYR